MQHLHTFNERMMDINKRAANAGNLIIQFTANKNSATEIKRLRSWRKNVELHLEMCLAHGNWQGINLHSDAPARTADPKTNQVLLNYMQCLSAFGYTALMCCT